MKKTAGCRTPDVTDQQLMMREEARRHVPLTEETECPSEGGMMKVGGAVSKVME